MKVVVYDTTTRRVSRQCHPVPGCSNPGVLVAWRDTEVVGKVIEGLTDRSHLPPLRDNVTTTFYRLDVVTGACDIGLRIPGEFAGTLLAMENGTLACCIDGAVILVDPADWSHRTAGTLAEPPRDWTFLGDDLYAILGTQIVSVRGFRTLT